MIALQFISGSILWIIMSKLTYECFVILLRSYMITYKKSVHDEEFARQVGCLVLAGAVALMLPAYFLSANLMTLVRQ